MVLIGCGSEACPDRLISQIKGWYCSRCRGGRRCLSSAFIHTVHEYGQSGINYRCCVCNPPPPPPPTTTTPPPPPSPESPSGGCFPSVATVKLSNGKSVAMFDLKTGDRVQTGKNKDLNFFSLIWKTLLCQKWVGMLIQVNWNSTHVVSIKMGH